MNWKSILLILLALGILVAGGAMPGLVGERMDERNENQVLLTAVEGVQLEFAGSGLSIRQVLSLAGSGNNSVGVPVELANLTQEDVERIVSDTAQRYTATGVLGYDLSRAEVLYSYTTLVYGLENQSNLFWTVGYGDKAGQGMFSFLLDDGTGTVCSVEYIAGEAIYSGRQEMEYVLSQVCQQYLTGLGEEFLDYRVADVIADAWAPADGTYLAGEILWETEPYGQGVITMLVNANGFYTMISH